jgi:hypothetical protein
MKLQITMILKNRIHLCFLFFCIPILFVPAQDESAEAAVLVSVTGTVAVAGDGPALEWSPASSGTLLQRGEAVRTGEDGSAVLLFSDGRKMTLHPNTMITVSKDEEQGGGLKRILAKLFASIRDKFADSEYTNAALGEVGAIRGEEDVASLKDYPLSGVETKEMDEKKAAVVLSGDGGPTDYIFLGILFEEYDQNYSAESAYMEGLRMAGFGAETEETSRLIKELLIDLYVKNELYRQAQKMRESVLHPQ